MVQSKIAAIEDSIYKYYSLKTESEKKDFLKESPNAIVPFMQAILQVDNVLTKDEERIYDKIKDLKKEIASLYKEHKQSSLGPELFEQAKLLTTLVD